MLTVITNLFPTPENPTRGLYNLQLFHELHHQTELRCIVPVANSNPLKRNPIQVWQHNSPFSVRYIPYCHIPRVGRNISWRLLSHALAKSTPHPPNTPILASWLYPDGTATAHRFGKTSPVWIMVLGTDRFHLQHPIRRKTILRNDQQVAGYICVAQNIADDLTTAGISPHKIHIIPNGVDTKRFHPIDTSKAIEQLNDNPEFQKLQNASHPKTPAYILWVGNLVKIKAPELAIESYAEFRKSQNSNLHLVIIGDGPLRPKLRKHISRLKLEKQIHLIGRQCHQELPYWINAAESLLLSSQSEGMPNIIAEAIACGIPTIATDVGACCTMLSNQPCTAIAPPNNTKALALALTSVIQNAAENQARPIFTRTWSDMATDILALINSHQPVQS